MLQPLLIPVSAAELLDKKTILEIKSERLKDASALANVRRELDLLTVIASRELVGAPELAALEAQLRAVNETLWDLENTVRSFEKHAVFGSDFVNAARSIYAGNDRRAAIKREINGLLGSVIVEEKCHGAG